MISAGAGGSLTQFKSFAAPVLGAVLAAGRVFGEGLSPLYTPTRVSCHVTWAPRSPRGCFQLGSLTQQRCEKGNPDCILGDLWGEGALKGERGENGHGGCKWQHSRLLHFRALLLKMTEVLLVHLRQRVPYAWEPCSQDSCPVKRHSPHRSHCRALGLILLELGGESVLGQNSPLLRTLHPWEQRGNSARWLGPQYHFTTVRASWGPQRKPVLDSGLRSVGMTSMYPG